MDKIKEILKSSGIVLNGPNTYDPKINTKKISEKDLINKIISGGSLALGESYMDDEWDVEDLEEFLFRITRNPLHADFLTIGDLLYFLKAKFFNLQSIKRAFQVAEAHYDLGNDLYESMLGETMSYTSGYWKETTTLDKSQIAKLDLICKKLDLKPGQRILDVGCGWGNFMRYAAKNYGVSCVGLTVSVGQTELAKKLSQGLPIEYVITDYRNYESKEKFDHIVSIEMIEAVGSKNMQEYFKKLNSLLKDDGLFLLQVIANTKTTDRVEPWIHKYIFPNGNLPSLKQIAKAIETKFNQENIFVVEDLHSLGIDYSHTLKAWFENFDENYESLRKNNPKYDRKFYRMWKYYLLMSSAISRSRSIFSWQIVFSKNGLLGGYKSVR